MSLAFSTKMIHGRYLSIISIIVGRVGAPLDSNIYFRCVVVSKRYCFLTHMHPLSSLLIYPRLPSNELNLMHNAVGLLRMHINYTHINRTFLLIFKASRFVGMYSGMTCGPHFSLSFLRACQLYIPPCLPYKHRLILYMHTTLHNILNTNDKMLPCVPRP